MLALVTVVTWELNFVVVKVGLLHIPPLMFTTLRFFLTAVPLVFFVRSPAVRATVWVPWGLTQFALQFSLLYSGIALGMAAGLTSLVAQTQVFFCIGLSMVIFSERPRVGQLVGALISLSGIVVLGSFLNAQATLMGFTLLLGAAATWAAANVMNKRMGPVDPLALVAWGSACRGTAPVYRIDTFRGSKSLEACSIDSVTWASPTLGQLTGMGCPQ